MKSAEAMIGAWAKPYVVANEIEAFTGGTVDYPTIAMWEAQDRLLYNADLDHSAFIESRCPKRVVTFAYHVEQDSEVVCGMFFGILSDPIIGYEAKSLAQWIERRIAGQEQRGRA